jgi:hypothetical protein
MLGRYHNLVAGSLGQEKGRCQTGNARAGYESELAYQQEMFLRITLSPQYSSASFPSIFYICL